MLGEPVPRAKRSSVGRRTHVLAVRTPTQHVQVEMIVCLEVVMEVV